MIILTTRDAITNQPIIETFNTINDAFMAVLNLDSEYQQDFYEWAYLTDRKDNLLIKLTDNLYDEWKQT